MTELYRHKKTGARYEKLSEAVDCTNVRDGTRVVIYSRAGYGVPQFVREIREFNEKFERLPDNG